jgi:adenylate kinase
MDKLQKFDYMANVESYLEQKQVYELFEDLLKQLIINKPANPLDFITEKLKQQQRNSLLNFLIFHSSPHLRRRHARCSTA